jgi:hypothetical protein
MAHHAARSALGGSSVTWRHARWTAQHPLPIGVVERTSLGENVNAGDVIAAGVALGTAIRVKGARHLRLPAADMERELRVPIGSEVTAGTLLARSGRRFPRMLKAPIDGRLLHLTANGDLFIAPIVGRWIVRSTLDGAVTRSDDAGVTVEGAAWCIAGAAAYGPDAIGELTLGVNSPTEDLAASRVDVRLGGRIMIGGARASAEVLTRAHACGVSGVVAGGAPAAGLRVVYGETVTASGYSGRDDRPTVICLIGFGAAALPEAIFRPLVALAGSRAAIHTASARLFVFAPADAGEFATDELDLALAPDYASVRALGRQTVNGDVTFPSEVRAGAVRHGDEVVPSANVRPFHAKR